jgi:hypothetical protein
MPGFPCLDQTDLVWMAAPRTRVSIGQSSRGQVSVEVGLGAEDFEARRTLTPVGGLATLRGQPEVHGFHHRFVVGLQLCSALLIGRGAVRFSSSAISRVESPAAVSSPTLSLVGCGVPLLGHVFT